MAFRRYGGITFSATNNSSHSQYSNISSQTIKDSSGLNNSVERFNSHINMNNNSLLNVGCIYFQDGSIQCSAIQGAAATTTESVATTVSATAVADVEPDLMITSTGLYSTVGEYSNDTGTCITNEVCSYPFSGDTSTEFPIGDYFCSGCINISTSSTDTKCEIIFASSANIIYDMIYTVSSSQPVIIPFSFGFTVSISPSILSLRTSLPDTSSSSSYSYHCHVRRTL